MYKENMRDAATSISLQYTEKKTTKLDELRNLDSKVKTPAIIVAYIIGIVGVLVMGAGMSNVMVWDNMAIGLALGIPGMILALLAYPIYKGISNKRKKQYAAKIIKLSKEIIDEDQ